MKFTTKKMIMTAILVAVAFAFVAFGRIPIVLFLSYDPKDIVIAIGGLMFGPFMAFMVSVITSVIEMFTISSTGYWGLLMNVISTVAFACPAAYIYQKKRSALGAMTGLLLGWTLMVVSMIVWNYLITPIYQGVPREVVAGMLLTVFLPFNLIKGGLNTAITFLVYKPVVTSLRKAKLIPKEVQTERMHFNIAIVVVALFILLSTVLFTLAFMKLI